MLVEESIFNGFDIDVAERNSYWPLTLEASKVGIQTVSSAVSGDEVSVDSAETSSTSEVLS